MGTIILGIIVLGILIALFVLLLPALIHALNDALLNLFFSAIGISIIAGAVASSVQFDIPLQYTLIAAAFLIIVQVGLYYYFKFKLVLKKEKEESGDGPYLKPTKD